MEILFLIALSLISSLLTREVAKSKGLERDSWTLAGFALGPLALLAVAGCADKRQQMILRLIAEKQGIIITDQERQGIVFGDPGNESRVRFSISRDASEEEIWEEMLKSMPANLSALASKTKSTVGPTTAEMRTVEGLTIFLFKNEGLLRDGRSFVWDGNRPRYDGQIYSP